MNVQRREFLQYGAAAGALLAASSIAFTNAQNKAKAPLQILILGGTGFLGPKTVEVALARGHKVTVFNRGRTEKRIPFGFEGVEHLYGNRDPELPADDERGPDGKVLRPDAKPKGLEQLVDRKWDVVIDNSGYYPRMVKASADLLAKNCKQYIFISSISAYAENVAVDANEDSKLAELEDPTVESMGARSANYGGLKVLCERAAQAAFEHRCAVVRPGYIVGPGDPTDRFTYWPVRIARGGTIAAPGTPDDPIQWIDVRDLAEFLVTLAENGTSGVFNACGPSKPGRFGDVIDSCVKLAQKPCEIKWVPSAVLAEKGDIGFQIWSPPEGDSAGFHTWNNDRAEKAGLRFRSLDDTLRAILAWWPLEVERRRTLGVQMTEDAKKANRPPPKLGDPEAWRAGPTPEQEAQLLEKLKTS